MSAGAGLTAAGSTSASVLVIDALNCLDFFCPYVQGKTGKRDPWQVVGVMRRRVRGFLEAAEVSGLSCKFVVDCGWSSSEARAKWRRRREREVRECFRGMIVGVDTLLVELLRQHGAEVYTAEGEDGDDIVALLAHHAGPGSLILSADRDMFRYQLPHIHHRLMETFRLQEQHTGGKIQYAVSLIPTSKTARPGVSCRDIDQLQQKITWAPELWLTPVSKMAGSLMEKSQGYIRGSSCSYIRDFGNVHGLLKPLRRAVYTLLRLPEQIREVYPEWDAQNNKILWVDELVTPSTEELPEELLCLGANPDDPQLAICARRWLEERDPSCSGAGRSPGGEPKERQYARCFLLAELLQIIPGSSRGVFEILQQVSGRQMEEKSSGGGWPPRTYLVGGPGRSGGRGRPERPSAADEAMRPTVELVCTERTCGRVFAVAPKEQLWFHSRGFPLPKRCKPCRAQRQSARR